MKKGVTRLIFLVVFLIPVAWYLFLQLFGSNKFSLSMMEEIDPKCGTFPGVTVLTKLDSVSLSKQNYLDRVRYAVDKKRIPLIKQEHFFFDCINQKDAELVLVDENGLWGFYELTRDGVDELITELDILLLQKSYGQGTDR